jgi:hypothetical protein
MITNNGIWGQWKDLAANNVFIVTLSGPPTDGTSGTGVGITGIGSILINRTTGIPYVNRGTITDVVWVPLQPSLINNYSVTSQSISAATRTYITGSQIVVPTAKLQIGTIIEWVFNMTKTAAGSASSTIDIAIGTAGTTADSAILSFTKPAGTAAADEALCRLRMIVRGPLSASGIIAGDFQMTHNLASTGHATIPCVNVNTISSPFDVTTALLKVGVCLTSGASDAITIQTMSAIAYNL